MFITKPSKFQSKVLLQFLLVEVVQLKGFGKKMEKHSNLAGTIHHLCALLYKVSFSLCEISCDLFSQIANAVVVARYLGATLVLPHIRGTILGEMRNFGGIYDVKKFVKSLDGIIKIAKDQPDEVSIDNVTIAEVPTREFNYLDSLSCLAMFGTLELQPALKEVIDLMVERLRALSHRSDGQFIAADLRVEMLEKRECQESGDSGTKWCYNAKAIGDFLRKIGFHRNTTIYLTQSKWHSMLDPLRNFYPKTYTKDDIMPADKKAKFLNANSPEFTKIIDSTYVLRVTCSCLPFLASFTRMWWEGESLLAKVRF
ncbi:hypothetical protein C3L33_03868, partial [Rhododendron williamsianum]